MSKNDARLIEIIEQYLKLYEERNELFKLQNKIEESLPDNLKWAVPQFPKELDFFYSDHEYWDKAYSDAYSAGHYTKKETNILPIYTLFIFNDMVKKKHHDGIRNNNWNNAFNGISGNGNRRVEWWLREYHRIQTLIDQTGLTQTEIENDKKYEQMCEIENEVKNTSALTKDGLLAKAKFFSHLFQHEYDVAGIIEDGVNKYFEDVEKLAKLKAAA